MAGNHLGVEALFASPKLTPVTIVQRWKLLGRVTRFVSHSFRSQRPKRLAVKEPLGSCILYIKQAVESSYCSDCLPQNTAVSQCSSEWLTCQCCHPELGNENASDTIS